MNNHTIHLSSDLDYLRPLQVPDLFRLGADQDGGYVIGRTMMKHSTALLSLGVGDDWSFDQQWYNHKPLDTIHAYDGSMPWDQISPRQEANYNTFWRHPRTHFPVNIAPHRGEHTVSFDRAMTAINSRSVMVKMDIEGGEWELTQHVCRHHDAITGLVVEFHDVGRLRDWFQDRVSQLLVHFDLLHVHGNNTCWQCDDGLPSVIELTFARHGLYPDATQRRSRLYLPDLDRPNHPDIPDIDMIFVD
jgi:hypothetical protein